MTRVRTVAALLLCWSAASATAQVRPNPGDGDAHFQWIQYKPNQVVLVEGAPGYQITVQLAPDEQISNIAVGDSGAWQVTASKSGDHLFIKPVQGGASTNMTVVTSNRVYAFELVSLSGPSGSMPYSIQFRYPSGPVVPVNPDRDKQVGFYKVSGDRALRPSAVDDDGVQTHIEWPESAALPAIYAVDADGREVLANGGMRDGLYVIDSINRHLIFRIDNRVARADRVLRKRKH